MTSRSRRLTSILAACLSATLAWPASSPAQETREREHAEAQAAKASTLVPPSPNVAERGLRRLKSLGLFTPVREGFYPEVTSVHPGGWLAFGGGYRYPVGDRGTFSVSSAWSLRAYRSVEAGVVLPGTLADGLTLEVQGRWMDAPTIDFHGVGNETRTEDGTTYGYRPTTLGATLTSEPAPTFTFGGGVELLVIDPVRTAAPLPVTATAGGTVPGLGAAPRYVRARGFARLDQRLAPGYTGRGGLYRVEVQESADRSGADLSFRSVEAEVMQLVPILRANWVIALRGLATVTDTGPTGAVPFYLMPSLGGSDALRGYPSFRFVGRHRMLMAAEVRWTATRYLDMAVFYDTGRVAQRLADLDLRGRKAAYGLGARFHGQRRTVLRIEAARNDEGRWRLIWTSGAAF